MRTKLPRIDSTPRQPNRSPTRPEKLAPSRLPVKAPAMMRLMATRRFSTGNRSPVSPIPTGNTPPAPSPQITRVISNSSNDLVNAPTTLATPRMIRQIRITFGLPNRSATMPSGNCTKAKAMAEADASVAAVVMCTASCSLICGTTGSMTRDVNPAAKFPIAMMGNRYCMAWDGGAIRRNVRALTDGCEIGYDGGLAGAGGSDQ